MWQQLTNDTYILQPVSAIWVVSTQIGDGALELSLLELNLFALFALKGNGNGKTLLSHPCTHSHLVLNITFLVKLPRYNIFAFSWLILLWQRSGVLSSLVVMTLTRLAWSRAGGHFNPLLHYWFGSRIFVAFWFCLSKWRAWIFRHWGSKLMHGLLLLNKWLQFPVYTTTDLTENFILVP